MRKAFAILIVLLGAAASSSTALEAPPEAAPTPQAVVSSDCPSNERELLTDILKELRAMRTDIRNLQRPTMPTAAPQPSAVKLGRGMALGNADAKVAIIEFSEFQCPFCKRYHEQTFMKLKESYVDTGKVLYEFRNFPLPIHQHARSAALAARCAAEQGAYWKMHDELFKAQSSLGAALYPQLAKTLALDEDRFQKCLTDPQKDKALSDDVAAAETLGVRGTPHFFLGHVKDGSVVSVRALSGAQSVESFRAALDALLGPSGGSLPVVSGR